MCERRVDADTHRNKYNAYGHNPACGNWILHLCALCAVGSLKLSSLLVQPLKYLLLVAI
jgi:hypothetical protein